MNFAERVPSSDWAAVEQLGEESAEAWFKPEGEPLAVAFRVPRSRFESDDLTRLPTVEDLLRAAAVPIGDVDSWRFLDESHSGMDGANPELQRLLPSPPPDANHLTVHVRLKQPADPPARTEGGGPDLTPEQWQTLDAAWKAILSTEAGIEGLRLGMEGLRAEMEGAFRRQLGMEEKVHAPQSDVAQWTKAKNRVHYALPKVREFIHRATWALTVAERKRLEEVVKTHIEPRVPLPRMDEVREELGHLLKDRQVLFAQGNTVNQEGRAILAEVQRAVGALQRNAADNARRKANRRP